MRIGWTRARFSPIAIDFGAETLKLLQLIPGEPPQLQAAAAVALPEEARQNAAARQSFFIDAIKQALREHPFKGRQAVCATPGHLTLIQHLQIAGGDNAQWAGQIDAELRERLDIEPERMVVRHVPVGSFVRNGSSKQEVICIAASRDAVLRQIQAAAAAGLEVVDMRCEPQAILGAFKHLYRRQSDADRTTCFIDLGARTAKVVIAHGREMVGAKTIRIVAPDGWSHTVGSTDAESTTSGATGMGGRSGLRAMDGTSGGTPAGLAVLDTQLPGQDLPTAHDDVLDCLIDEIQLCLRYHRTMFTDRAVEKLVFLGGASRNVAWCERIARSLRITAQLGDPLARFARAGVGATPGVDTRQPQPGWAVPAGLCVDQM